MTDYTTEVKKLVEATYADFPRTHRQGMASDLFCNSLNHAYLQRHLLVMKPQSFMETVRARNEYLQIRLNSNLGVTIQQIDGETVPD